MTSVRSVRIYKFAGFTLNPAKRTLFSEETEIKLRDKDFDVLLFLIESVPNTCSHNEIIENVWKGTSVENNSVEKAITNIRNVLGDNAKSPRFIKTVRAKGYLFIGDLKEAEKDLSNNRNQQPQEAMTETILPKKNSKSKIALICLSFVFLFGLAGIFWWKGREVWARYNSTVIFADDFSNGEIDSNSWMIKGNTVKVENGTAKITVEETDRGGRLESTLFAFDPSKSLTVKSRLKISPSQNIKDSVFFIGIFSLDLKTSSFDPNIHNKDSFGIKYANHDYESRYPNGDFEFLKVEGWFPFRNAGAPQRKVDYRDGKIGGRIEPFWNQWFEQKIVYEPLTGKISYYINEELKETFNSGDLLKNIDEYKLRIYISPEGWWLNHSIDIDYIEVTQ